MIEHLTDYKVKLIVDGEPQTVVTLARTPNIAKLDALVKARRMLNARKLEVVSVKPVIYKPLA